MKTMMSTMTTTMLNLTRTTMKNKILLLGSTGYVGQEFVRQLNSRGVHYHTMSAKGLDPKVLEERIAKLGIDTIINAAGYVGKPNVDACEDHKLEALEGNFLLPAMLGSIASRRNLILGHVSSGCIFNGYKQGGFTEEDRPNFSFDMPPSSFYSGTKALGESALKNVATAYVWRLRIPFDNQDSPRNYLTKVMSYDTLLNVQNSLSNRVEYVRACLNMIERQVPFGVYNVTNEGSVTAREVVELIKKYKLSEKDFKFFDNLDQFNSKVRTPRSNTILNTKKLRSVGLGLSNVHQSLETSLRNWRKNE